MKLQMTLTPEEVADLKKIHLAVLFLISDLVGEKKTYQEILKDWDNYRGKAWFPKEI
jgi:hypothetical protein